MQKTVIKEVSVLLGNSFEKVESASLRHKKILHIGHNTQHDELKKVVQIANQTSRLPPAIPCHRSFELKLGGRLMVDVANGVLENAGLALHRHFNCPYIPGSALKGIARHQAWEEWNNSSHTEKNTIESRAIKVFGSGFESENSMENQIGSISFLNAYPSSSNWQLVTDVINPHGGNDYTNPVPCFFIAVEKGASFQFKLKKIRDDDASLAAAETWLKRGLHEHGVGAKTGAGYGWFTDENSGGEKRCIIELSSPGFFGGADVDNSNDTTLRAPSLRGNLRWWWRTLYRDQLSAETLKQLEDALWGSTSAAGLIGVRTVESKENEIYLFNFKDRFQPKPEFARAHDINPKKSGIFYLAYGMDENEKRRYFCAEGSRWDTIFSTRNNQAAYDITINQRRISLTRQEVMNQAWSALSLLCRYGGVGSKSRNGFGSLHWDDAYSLEKCRALANDLLQRVGTGKGTMDYSWEKVYTSETEIACSDVWTVLDRLGLAANDFAASLKHNVQKAVLGLPRKIHGPNVNPLRHQSPHTHQKPEQLRPALKAADNGSKTRFASPVFYHLEKTPDGMKLRITAFPSGMIGENRVSEAMLNDLVQVIANDMTNELWHTGKTRTQLYNQNRSNTHKTQLTAGQEITGILLETKTKKGGWRIEIPNTRYAGPIVNTTDVPVDNKTGDKIIVIVNSANPDNPSFRYKKQ